MSLEAIHNLFEALNEGDNLYNDQVGTASAVPWNSGKSDLRCMPVSMTYFDNLTLTLHKVTLTSPKPSKCYCSKPNGYK